MLARKRLCPQPRFRAPRQLQAHLSAAFRAILGPRLAAVGLGYPTNQRQTKAQATSAAAVKCLKRPFELILGKAGTRIEDPDEE